MATSNEYDLDLTLNDVLVEAFDILQIGADGESLNGDMKKRGTAALNIMIKLWEAQGIHLWTYTEGTLFLTVGQSRYDFNNDVTTRLVGSNDYKRTTVSAAAAAGAATIVVVDSTDFVVGGNIGVITNEGNLFFTQIDKIVIGVSPAATITLRAVIPTGRTVLNAAQVFAYAPEKHFATTLASTIAAPTNVFNVASASGIVVGMVIGAEFTASNNLSYTTVTAVSGVQVTTTANIPIAAIGDDMVFYTKLNPLVPVTRIILNGIRRQENDDYEIPIVDASRYDYFNLPNKTVQGNPIQAYYDRQEPTGVMYLWNAPSNSEPVINFTFERKIQIMVSNVDTFDFPTEWYDAITYNLAKRLIPKYGASPELKLLIAGNGTPQMPGLAQEYLDQALAFDQSVYPIRLKPARYG